MYLAIEHVKFLRSDRKHNLYKQGTKMHFC